MEAVTWAGLIAAAVAILAVIKFGMSLGATQAQVKENSEGLVILTAKQEYVSVQLTDHKVHVAQTYATSKALNDTEAALAQGIQIAIQGVYSRLDKMTDRLDTLIAKDR